MAFQPPAHLSAEKMPSRSAVDASPGSTTRERNRSPCSVIVSVLPPATRSVASSAAGKRGPLSTIAGGAAPITMPRAGSAMSR